MSRLTQTVITLTGILIALVVIAIYGWEAEEAHGKMRGLDPHTRNAYLAYSLRPALDSLVQKLGIKGDEEVSAYWRKRADMWDNKVGNTNYTSEKEHFRLMHAYELLEMAYYRIMNINSQLSDNGKVVKTIMRTKLRRTPRSPLVDDISHERILNEDAKFNGNW